MMMKSGEQKALQLFHNAAKRVPAYKDFLKRALVNPDKIKTIKDFAGVPPTDAKNYIAAYPLEKRCWDGTLSATQLIAASSGTTGEPKFWPRTADQDLEAALVHERLYKMYFNIDKRSTLLLIGFPMGVYVSGIATVLPSWLVARKYPGLTVMTIGNNKAEMLRAVRHLSGAYEQTILIGHPFFIKDVIETGADEGIVWRKKNLGLMFCSGGFSEAWREYVAKKAGIASSAIRIFNTYGSSEMLLMGYETPFSIEIKQAMEKDSHFLKDLIGEVDAPQLFQYDPTLRYIESTGTELVFTAESGIPLIRFNLHDRGDIIPLNRAAELMQKYNHAIRAAVFEPQLPLVSMWGRSDDTLKFHAVNIYPEHIKSGLMDKQFLRLLTGKFVMRKLLGKKMDEAFEINVELTPGVRASRHLKQEIANRVTQKLRKINLEYMDMSSHLGVKTYPRIILRPYQDSQYFKPGLKPRYIDRSSK
jgi:phenylacetate-CoA ligase